MLEDPQTHQLLAAKFFLSRRAFRHEHGIYHDAGSPIGKFLPQLYGVVPEGALVDLQVRFQVRI